MRQIDSGLLSRILSNVQTPRGNNNPSMEIIISRAVTGISRKEYWQESIVTAGATATCTSVAVEKSGRKIGYVYVSYVSGTTLTVKRAMFALPIKKMIWEVVTTVSGAVACALEFDGLFVRVSRNVEYRTNTIPWLFYTTTSGELWAGILGGTFERLAAAGATTIDAVRGIASPYKDIDQGMVIFYILNNAVYYRQLIAGTWQGQQQVTTDPPNPVSIKAERLFDYRICLQIKDSAGALWEVFTKMEASGWNGTEYISASLSQKTELIEVYYRDIYKAENITLSMTQATKLLYIWSPVMISAENLDNGSGNYGLKVRLKWNENIFGAAGHAGNFSLSDAYSSWSGQSLVQDGNDLLITFVDFNNAINPVTVTYMPGTMTGDIETVETCSIEFNAVGLVPSVIQAPIALTAENMDAKHIIVSFDAPVESANWSTDKAGFMVTAQEYDMIPGGTASLKTYEIVTAGYPESKVTANEESLAGATVIDTVFVNNAIKLAEDI